MREWSYLIPDDAINREYPNYRRKRNVNRKILRNIRARRVVTEDERILIPAGIMHKTEGNVNFNNKIKMALGTRNVVGYNEYQGTAFVVEGIAKLVYSGAEFDMMKSKFSFVTRVLEITVTSVKQML